MRLIPIGQYLFFQSDDVSSTKSVGGRTVDFRNPANKCGVAKVVKLLIIMGYKTNVGILMKQKSSHNFVGSSFKTAAFESKRQLGMSGRFRGI